ncbi:MAG TPA: hypothetical protein VMW27_05385 [Thermoanaerobaculia bacterium]|nr:hypothetical protein [Thermoanaerobaculia bacterium]
MASNTSFADFVHGWEQLLAALDINGSELPDVSVHRQPLEKVLVDAKAISARQDAHRAGLGLATRELAAVMLEGRDAPNRLRNFLKSHHGLRSDKLTEYGVKPLRKRSQLKSKKKPLVVPAVQEAPADPQ